MSRCDVRDLLESVKEILEEAYLPPPFIAEMGTYYATDNPNKSLVLRCIT
jgi:hypothetical protein